MRKKEREITDPAVLESIMAKAVVCRIGLSLNDIPYVVPVNFGYKGNQIYFHSSLEGMKIEILRLTFRAFFCGFWDSFSFHSLVVGSNQVARVNSRL